MAKITSLVRSSGYKIGLFIDGSNFYDTFKALNMSVDYNSMLRYFRRKGTIVKALYYTAVRVDPVTGKSLIRPTLDWLSLNGFSVIEKPTREYRNENRLRIKGNMDVEIAVDMLSMAPKLDHIYFFSGDGDFTYLLRTIQQIGVRVTVVSSTRCVDEHGKPLTILSEDLRRQADEFLELAELADVLRRPQTTL